MDFLQAAQPWAHTEWPIPHKNHRYLTQSHSNFMFNPSVCPDLCVASELFILRLTKHCPVASAIDSCYFLVFWEWSNQSLDGLSWWDVGVACAGPGAGFSDPFASPPTQEILWFLGREPERGSLFSLHFFHHPPPLFFFFSIDIHNFLLIYALSTFSVPCRSLFHSTNWIIRDNFLHNSLRDSKQLNISS